MSIKNRTLAYGIAAIAIAAIIVASSMFVGPYIMQGLGGQKSTNNIPMVVQLTDPPNVPKGTQSLNLTYADIQLEVVGGAGGNTSQWISTNSQGTVNLLSLVNVSRTIAVVQIPNDSQIMQVRFVISSVRIAVNGTVYPVATSTNILTVPIANSGNPKLEAEGATLLELSPTVTQVSTGTSTTNITQFLLVPSATAIVRSSNVSSSEAFVGSQQDLSSNEVSDLKDASGNISITASSLSVSSSNSTTTLSLTIRNTGNVSVALQSVTLHGNLNLTSALSTTCISTTTTSSNGDQNGDGGPNGCSSEIEIEYPNEATFMANGTTLTPSLGSDTSSSNGYSALVISPGQQVTVTFTGVISIVQGDSSSQVIHVLPFVGSTYTLQADLSNDAHATMQVNATS